MPEIERQQLTSKYGLSTRAAWALLKNGKNTTEFLKTATDEDILIIRGVGPKILGEIRKAFPGPEARRAGVRGQVGIIEAVGGAIGYFLEMRRKN